MAAKIKINIKLKKTGGVTNLDKGGKNSVNVLKTGRGIIRGKARE